MSMFFKKPLAFLIFFITTYNVMFAQLNAGQTSNSLPTCPGAAHAAKDVHIVILGSSTAEGVGSWPLNAGHSWAEKFTAHLKSLNTNNKVTNLAKGGLNLNYIMPTSRPYGDWPAPDTARNITKALRLKPSAIIIAMASNDASMNRGVARQLKQFKEIIDSARARKIPVWVTTTQPRKFGASEFYGYAIQDKMQDTLRDVYGSYTIDFWTGLSRPDPAVAGSIYLTKRYYNSDSIHLNNDGHNFLYQRILSKDILSSLTIALDKNLVYTPVLSCGQAASVQIQDSQPGIGYYLHTQTGNPVSGPLAGNGSTIAFSVALAGSYKIYAVNQTNGCSLYLSTPIIISNGPGAPLNKNVIPTQSQISAGNSTKIRVILSQVGVTYRLKDLADVEHSSLVGTGTDLDLSTLALTSSKSFKVVAEKDGCTRVMEDTVSVSVIEPANMIPLAEILTPATNSNYRGGQTISFSGNGTDIEDGTLPATAFSWKVDFYKGNQRSNGPSVSSGVKSGTFIIPANGETADNVFYRLTLIVTDSKGAKDTSSVDLHPYKTNIGLNSQPSGLKVKLENVEKLTPATVSGVEGIQRTLGVVSPQLSGGKTYLFSHWVHGGSATQTITTPIDDVTYTAVFTEDNAPGQNGLNYAYYEGNWSVLPDFEALSPVKTGTSSGLDLALRNRDNFFGFKFTGYLNIPTEGQYTIYLTSDDGAKLFIDNALVIDNDGNHSAWERSVVLTLSQGKHPLKVIYFDKELDQVLSLAWKGPGITTKQTIPASAYFLQSVPVNTPPTIATQPVASIVKVGQVASFSVAVSGSSPLSYQWQKDGVNISGATSSAYSITNAQPSHAGLYKVIVTNPYGSITSNTAELKVNIPPSITTQPISVAVNPGQAAGFSITASGTAPLTYQWQKDGVNISGAASSTYSIPATLTTHAGKYKVVVTNAAGSTTSNEAQLTVNVAPSITSQPTALTVNAGQPASFSVVATGASPLTYQWQKDGANISGATSSTYSIAATQTTHAGKYKVVVTNTAGSITSNEVQLTVNVAPSITSQPTALSVNAGEPASFSVVASGVSPLAYQWQKDGANISGATAANYTISNAQSSHAGLYRVVVSNSAGSVTSTAAQLTVLSPDLQPLAEILTPAVNTNYRGGSTISFSGNGTDVEDGILPASAFSWKVDFFKGTTRSNGPTVSNGVKSGSFIIPSSGETSDNVYYKITLVVTDSKGGKDTAFVDILPYKTTISLTTQPSGLQVKLDDQIKNTPAAVVGVEGIQRTLGVISPQASGGKTYVFSHWIHGGTATQTISTPTDDITYTAVFTEDNTPSPNGLNYSYYEGSWSVLPNFDALTPVKTGISAGLDLSLRNRDNFFGFKFTGYLDIPSTGLYTIYLTSDDGAKLFIDNVQVIDNDGNHQAWERSVNLNLEKGKHVLKVIYFDREFDQVLTLAWKGPGITTKQLIPAQAFYHSDSSPVAKLLGAPESPEVTELLTLTSASVNVYPNPSVGVLKVTFEAVKGEKVSFTTIDPAGRQMRARSIVAQYNGTNKEEIDVSHLGNGLFILQIKKENASVYKQFLVNK